MATNSAEQAIKNPGVLRRSRPFRYLWAARSISHIGDGFAAAALVLHVESTVGSGSAVAMILAAQTLPRLLGPVTGALADRFDRRPIMITCELGQMAIYALVALTTPSLLPLAGYVVVAALLATTFAPASRSAIPLLVRSEDLMGANAWAGIALNLRVVVGPAVGAILFETIGFGGALAVNAASFLLSGALLFALPTLKPAVEAADPKSVYAETREALAFVRRHSVAGPIVMALFLGVAFAAVDDVALVFLVRDELDGSALAFGVAASAYGIGMIVGSIGLLRPRPGRSATFFFLMGWLLSALGTLGTGVSPVLAAVFLMQALAGAGNALNNTAGDTLLQQNVPAAMLGRVFGLSVSAAVSGSIVAYAAGGFLLELTSPRAVFIVGGTGVIAVFVFLQLVLFASRDRPSRG
ncbi:MAG: MFS transporter [Actinomycetota bacterium]|nr:MFS transporter [Actinomycetota bacterium]